jgi:hypothetical protein
METKQAESEIAVIKKIMEDSKRIAASDGKDFILWGVLVLLGVLGMYYLLMMNLYDYIGLLWGIDILIGWIFSITMHIRSQRKSRVHTFAGKILGGLWASCGIAMSIIGFVAGMTGALSGWTIFPVIGIILGIAYFVTGIIYGYTWVNYLSFGWWIGSIFMLFFPGIYNLIVFAFMMTFLQIIPGIIFYLRWRREYNTVAV